MPKILNKFIKSKEWLYDKYFNIIESSNNNLYKIEMATCRLDNILDKICDF